MGTPTPQFQSPADPGSFLEPGHRWLVLALTAAIFVFSGVRFDGPSRGYWDTYITLPAIFMTGQAVDLHGIDGTPRYQ
jgi:hypothetical protein